MRKRMQQENNPSCFDQIPFDLLIDIFSRLPVKSKAQCRCVSKLWSSIIRFPNYNQLFPIKSPATPRLLLVFNVGSNLFFYSSTQPQNPVNDSSLVATYHHTYLGKDFYDLCRPVGGLVCSQHISDYYSWAVITNPITREYVTTPKVKVEGIDGWINGKPVYYSFGYDPIDKQFKVLRITSSSCYHKYHVLTLRTGYKNHLLWRNIQCCAFQYPVPHDYGICINGVLYYPALIDNIIVAIVCFDVRSEKFSFINLDQGLTTKIWLPFSLINYKGKLCVYVHDYITFQLWVLEDVEKHKWSKHVYQNPLSLLAETSSNPCAAGITDTGEIVLHLDSARSPFFFYYHNLENNIRTRVRLQVPVGSKSNYGSVYTFLNYVEDVKLM